MHNCSIRGKLMTSIPWHPTRFVTRFFFEGKRHLMEESATRCAHLCACVCVCVCVCVYTRFFFCGVHEACPAWPDNLGAWERSWWTIGFQRGWQKQLIYISACMRFSCSVEIFNSWKMLQTVWGFSGEAFHLYYLFFSDETMVGLLKMVLGFSVCVRCNSSLRR